MYTKMRLNMIQMNDDTMPPTTQIFHIYTKLYNEYGLLKITLQVWKVHAL